MVKLIASDLDGTLLQNGAHDVNPIVFDQIRTLKEHGIIFAAASGRQYLNLRRYCIHRRKRLSLHIQRRDYFQRNY